MLFRDSCRRKHPGLSLTTEHPFPFVRRIGNLKKPSQANDVLHSCLSSPAQLLITISCFCPPRAGGGGGGGGGEDVCVCQLCEVV